MNAVGMTLYLFTPDSMETSACTDDCLGAWAPAMDEVAGEGVDPSLLTTAPPSTGFSSLAK